MECDNVLLELAYMGKYAILGDISTLIALFKLKAIVSLTSNMRVGLMQYVYSSDYTTFAQVLANLPCKILFRLA